MAIIRVTLLMISCASWHAERETFLANTELTILTQKNIAKTLNEILTRDLAFQFGFGWRWIIGFDGELFHDSTTRTVKYKQDGVMCVMWETTGSDTVHVKVEKDVNFSIAQRDDIVAAYKKIVSGIGALRYREEFENFPRKLLHECYTECLLNFWSRNGPAKQQIFWYIVISKHRTTFAYAHFYYLIDVTLDDSLCVLLVGVPVYSRNQERPVEYFCCSLGVRVVDTRNWGEKIRQYVKANVKQQAVCKTVARNMESDTGYRWLCVRIPHTEQAWTASKQTLLLRKDPYEFVYTENQWDFVLMCTYEPRW